MPEYIDKKAADNALTAAAVADSDKKRRTWAKAIGVLHDIPAADVAPVVYGKWEVHEVDCFTKFATCTACGEYATDIPEEIHEQGFNITAHKPVLTRCCPNCGAKMDLEEDK